MPDAELLKALDAARAAAEAAGRIALEKFRHRPQWRRKADGSPVSEVDMAVNALLREKLRDLEPDAGWLSEETADKESWRACRRAWVVDPLDGTRGFLQGDKHFSIVIALLEKCRPVLGIIHAPALQRTWAAAKGHGAWLNGASIHVSERSELAGARLVAPGHVREAGRWRAPWPEVEVLRYPSLALRMAYVASAEADAMFSLGGKNTWDVAAGDVIVREAGGIVSAADGAPLDYAAPDLRVPGIVASAPGLYDEIIRRLKGFGGCGHRRAKKGKGS